MGATDHIPVEFSIKSVVGRPPNTQQEKKSDQTRITIGVLGAGCNS